MKFHFFRLCILIPLQSIIAFINCTESLSQPILLETNPELTQKSNNLKVFTSHFGGLLSNNSDVNPFALMEEESLGQLKIGMAATQVFQLLGSPTKKSKSILLGFDGLYHQNWYYPRQGITLGIRSEIVEKQQEVASLTLVSCYAFKLLVEIRQKARGKRQERKTNRQFRCVIAYHSLS